MASALASDTVADRRFVNDEDPRRGNYRATLLEGELPNTDGRAFEEWQGNYHHLSDTQHDARQPTPPEDVLVSVKCSTYGDRWYIVMTPQDPDNVESLEITMIRGKFISDDGKRALFCVRSNVQNWQYDDKKYVTYTNKLTDFKGMLEFDVVGYGNGGRYTHIQLEARRIKGELMSKLCVDKYFVFPSSATDDDSTMKNTVIKRRRNIRLKQNMMAPRDGAPVGTSAPIDFSAIAVNTEGTFSMDEGDNSSTAKKRRVDPKPTGDAAESPGPEDEEDDYEGDLYEAVDGNDGNVSGLQEMLDSLDATNRLFPDINTVPPPRTETGTSESSSHGSTDELNRGGHSGPSTSNYYTAPLPTQTPASTSTVGQTYMGYENIAGPSSGFVPTHPIGTSGYPYMPYMQNYDQHTYGNQHGQPTNNYQTYTPLHPPLPHYASVASVPQSQPQFTNANDQSHRGRRLHTPSSHNGGVTSRVNAPVSPNLSTYATSSATTPSSIRGGVVVRGRGGLLHGSGERGTMGNGGRGGTAASGGRGGTTASGGRGGMTGSGGRGGTTGSLGRGPMCRGRGTPMGSRGRGGITGGDGGQVIQGSNGRELFPTEATEEEERDSSAEAEEFDGDDEDEGDGIIAELPQSPLFGKKLLSRRELQMELAKITDMRLLAIGSMNQQYLWQGVMLKAINETNDPTSKMKPLPYASDGTVQLDAGKKVKLPLRNFVDVFDLEELLGKNYDYVEQLAHHVAGIVAHVAKSTKKRSKRINGVGLAANVIFGRFDLVCFVVMHHGSELDPELQYDNADDWMASPLKLPLNSYAIQIQKVHEIAVKLLKDNNVYEPNPENAEESSLSGWIRMKRGDIVRRLNLPADSEYIEVEHREMVSDLADQIHAQSFQTIDDYYAMPKSNQLAWKSCKYKRLPDDRNGAGGMLGRMKRRQMVPPIRGRK